MHIGWYCSRHDLLMGVLFHGHRACLGLQRQTLALHARWAQQRLEQHMPRPNYRMSSEFHLVHWRKDLHAGVVSRHAMLQENRLGVVYSLAICCLRCWVIGVFVMSTTARGFPFSLFSSAVFTTLSPRALGSYRCEVNTSRVTVSSAVITHLSSTHTHTIRCQLSFHIHDCLLILDMSSVKNYRL